MVGTPDPYGPGYTPLPLATPAQQAIATALPPTALDPNAAPPPSTPPPAPPQGSQASTALQPAGTMTTPPPPPVGNTVDMQRAMTDPAYRAAIIPPVTPPGSGLPPAANAPQMPVAGAVTTALATPQTASEEAVSRGVPLKQVIAERMAASPPTDAQGTGTPTDANAGGAAVTAPTPTTAVSEPATTAPPDTAQLKGARGGEPGGTGTGISENQGDYPPVTPRVTQSAGRYNQFAKDDPQFYNLVNKVATDVGISPINLFNMMYAQSGSTDKDGKIVINQDAPNGVMNISPQEASTIDLHGHFTRDDQGNLVNDPTDTLNSLYLGAWKMKNLQAYFGTNVASATAAYQYGADKVNAASRMAPQDQEKVLPGFSDFVEKANGRYPPTSAVPSSTPAPAAPASATPGPLGDPTGAGVTAPPAAAPPGGAPAAAPAGPGAPAPAPAPVPAPTGAGAPPAPAPAAPTPTSVAAPQAAPSPPGTPQHVLTGQGSMTPLGLISAAQRGPQGFMTYMVNNAPNGMNTGDMWHQAASLLSGAFLLRGNIEGAQRAQEYVFQQAHVGAGQALMQAYSAMSTNPPDLNGTAQLLAKAHTFFPDGTAGGFQVINGQIWGQRFDEQSGQPMGQPFQVTKQSIASAMNMTVDPQKYLSTLREEQQLVETNRHNMATEAGTTEGHQVEREGIAARLQETNERLQEMAQYRQSQIDAQNERTRLTVEQRAEAARERLAGQVYRQGQMSQARQAEIDKESQTFVSDPTDPTVQGWSDAQKAQAAQTYSALRFYGDGVSPYGANDMAKGLMPTTNPQGQQQPSRYMTAVSPTGNTVAIVDRANPSVVKTYIPANQALRYGIVTPQQMGPQQQQGQPPPQTAPAPQTALQPM